MTRTSGGDEVLQINAVSSRRQTPFAVSDGQIRRATTKTSNYCRRSKNRIFELVIKNKALDYRRIPQITTNSFNLLSAGGKPAAAPIKNTESITTEADDDNNVGLLLQRSFAVKQPTYCEDDDEAIRTVQPQRCITHVARPFRRASSGRTT